jgi:hypothetical protein
LMTKGDSVRDEDKSRKEKRLEHGGKKRFGGEVKAVTVLLLLVASDQRWSLALILTCRHSLDLAA